MKGVPVIRPIRVTDEAGLQQFVRNLSPASRYPGFMIAIRELPEDMLDRFVHPEQGREVVLVVSSPDGDIIGLTQYVADESGDGCEVAIVVADAWHRMRLGTDLLAALISFAQRNGIAHVHADVLADTYAMLTLARKLGCEARIKGGRPTWCRSPEGWNRRVSQCMRLPWKSWGRGSRGTRNPSPRPSPKGRGRGSM